MATSLATLARQQVAAEKRAAKELHLVARVAFKATNATLYAIRSQDKVYHVTCIAGHVSSCIDSATGETCQGWHYTGKCKHAAFVVAFENEHGALEARRQDELAVAAQVAPLVLGEQFSEDLRVHGEDAFSGQAVVGDIHPLIEAYDMGPREPEQAEDEPVAPRGELKRQVLAEAQDAWALLSKEQQQAAYRELYPDDFYFVA